MQPIIEINDPAVDKTNIHQQIKMGISQRPPLPDLSQIGPAQLYPNARKTEDLDANSFPSLHESIVDLMMTHRLEETEFTSNAPVVGSLIVAFRRLWNWVSTKWYVIPIMQQQSHINSKLAVLIMQIVERQSQKEQQLEVLTERITQLESQLRESRR